MAEVVVFVRRDIWGLAPDDPIVTAYGNAVKRMKERPDDDPTSWCYQAAMHGTYAKPNKPRWNECQHGTWYFLPWHRMFLYYFERIVRAAIAADEHPEVWALPYWNYGLGGQRALLPLAFRDPTVAGGEENALYVAERKLGMNSGKGAIPERFGSPAKALARPAFIGKAEFGGDRTEPAQFNESGGELEETPHNVVHGEVGGSGPMGDIRRAAQDPIFWLHHANIDRIWSVWSGEAGHVDPPDAAWRNRSFSFFDEHGQPVSLRGDQVLETISDLGYRYDTQPPAAPVAPPAAPTPERPAAAVRPPAREMVGATEQPVVLTGEQVSVAVPIDARAATPIPLDARTYLNVEEIEGERNPGTGYAVYADPSADEPLEQQEANHVGNLSFFGIERAREPAGDEAPHTLQSSFEITPIARELEERGLWGGHDLQVVFEPLGLTPAPGAEPEEIAPTAHPEQPVRIGRVSVFYDA